MRYHWILSWEFVKKRSYLVLLVLAFWIWMLFRQYPFSQHVVSATVGDFFYSFKTAHMDGWAVVELLFPIFLLCSFFTFLSQSGKKESLGVQPLIMFGDHRKWIFDEMFMEIFRSELVVLAAYVIFLNVSLASGLCFTMDLSESAQYLLQGELSLKIPAEKMILEFIAAPILYCMIISIFQYMLSVLCSPLISINIIYILLIFHHNILSGYDTIVLISIGLLFDLLLTLAASVRAKKKDYLL